MSPERHEKSEDRQFRGVLALAYSRDRAYNLWLIMPVSDQGQLAALPLTTWKKATTLRWKAQGKATRTAWQSAISSSQLWLIRTLQLLISREVKQRENDEKLKSLVHYIVFCGKQNNLLRGHPNEKVKQATVSRLSSASDGPGIVLLDKEAGSPGNSIALLKFQAQADDAALLRNFRCNTY